MRINTSIRRETIALYAAANMLFTLVATIVALLAGASLAAIPLVLVTVVYAFIAIAIAITQTSEQAAVAAIKCMTPQSTRYRRGR